MNGLKRCLLGGPIQKFSIPIVFYRILLYLIFVLCCSILKLCLTCLKALLIMTDYNIVPFFYSILYYILLYYTNKLHAFYEHYHRHRKPFTIYLVIMLNLHNYFHLCVQSCQLMFVFECICSFVLDIIYTPLPNIMHSGISCILNYGCMCLVYLSRDAEAIKRKI